MLTDTMNALCLPKCAVVCQITSGSSKHFILHLGLISDIDAASHLIDCLGCCCYPKKLLGFLTSVLESFSSSVFIGLA